MSIIRTFLLRPGTALALALISLAASPALAQKGKPGGGGGGTPPAGFTYDAEREILTDNANGREWQCGLGLDWSYRNYFALKYDQAKDVSPVLYSAGPYGDDGGWRMPTTAELTEAIQHGLFQELVDVAEVARAFQVANNPPQFEHELCIIPEAWWPFWVQDPKTNSKNAFYLVLGTGARKSTLRTGSTMYVLLVR